MKILVVDNLEAFRLLVERHLQSAGYDVTVVDGGLACLEAAKSESFDLVLLDFMMPVMSGPETLTALRGCPGYETTPVCFVSAELPFEHERLITKHQVKGWLTKPVKKDRLLQFVKEVLGNAGAPPP